MSVYVDDMQANFGRMIMCHMVADTLQELHEMAEKIGMRRSWFQDHRYPHYDISKSKRAMAVKLGAVEVTQEEVVLMRQKYIVTSNSDDTGVAEAK